MAGFLEDQASYWNNVTFSPPTTWDPGTGDLGSYYFNDINSGAGTEAAEANGYSLVSGAQTFTLVVDHDGSNDITVEIQEITYDTTVGINESFTVDSVVWQGTYTSSQTTAEITVALPSQMYARVKATTGGSSTTFAGFGSATLVLQETASSGVARFWRDKIRTTERDLP